LFLKSFLLVFESFTQTLVILIYKVSSFIKKKKNSDRSGVEFMVFVQEK
jgi:hypothetical protein